MCFFLVFKDDFEKDLKLVYYINNDTQIETLSMKLSYEGLKEQLSFHLHNNTLSNDLLNEMSDNYLNLIKYATVISGDIGYHPLNIQEKSEALMNRLSEEPLNQIGEAYLDLMNQHQPLRGSFENQSFLIERMKALGYGIEEDGLCFGISHMAMQAFLIGDFDTFYDRLIAIHDTSLNEFQAPRGVTPVHSNKIKSFLPFFDGIALYQYPDIFKSVFFSKEEQTIEILQDEKRVLPITAPVATDNQQELMPVKVASFPGTYEETNLQDYLDLMQENLGKISFSLMIGSYLTLGYGYHEINLNFDAKHQKWILVDPNHLPPKDYLNTHLLAQTLIKNMSASWIEQTLSTIVYTQQVMKVEFETAYAGMIAQNRWKELHPVSASTLRRGQGQGYSELAWTFLISDNPEWVSYVLDVHGELDSYALRLLVLYGNPLVIDRLIEQGRILNKDTNPDRVYMMLKDILQQQWTDERIYLLISHLGEPQDTLIINIINKKNFSLLPFLLNSKKEALQPQLLTPILNLPPTSLSQFVYDLDLVIIEQLLAANKQNLAIQSLLTSAKDLIEEQNEETKTTQDYKEALNEIKQDSPEGEPEHKIQP